MRYWAAIKNGIVVNQFLSEDNQQLLEIIRLANEYDEIIEYTQEMETPPFIGGAYSEGVFIPPPESEPPPNPCQCPEPESNPLPDSVSTEEPVINNE